MCGRASQRGKREDFRNYIYKFDPPSDLNHIFAGITVLRDFIRLTEQLTIAGKKRPREYLHLL